MLWAGVGIALVIALPTLLWQAVNGWPQLGMAAVVVNESPMLSGGRIGTARDMVLFAGLAGAFLLCFGVWRLLTAAELRAYRFFGASVVLLYVLFVATAARPYYLAGIYGVALAAARSDSSAAGRADGRGCDGWPGRRSRCRPLLPAPSRCCRHSRRRRGPSSASPAT
ncbi:hypothetical protein ACFQ0O_04370 [Saccharopolyspora spinosporotrichia]